MKKQKIAILAVIGALSLSACKQTTSENPQTQQAVEQTDQTEVDYTVAKHYFVKNDVEGQVPTKITSTLEFDTYFGMASVMGDGGQPTTIDFDKQFVIVVDHQPTNKSIELKPVSLMKEGSDLVLTYKVIAGEEMSYTTHPTLILIVSKADDANVVLKKE